MPKLDGKKRSARLYSSPNNINSKERIEWRRRGRKRYTMKAFVPDSTIKSKTNKIKKANTP
jgi:hypothetical protein